MLSLYFSIMVALSPPARVVWIEICEPPYGDDSSRSPPARVVWIEISICAPAYGIVWSPPARVVWIEIYMESLELLGDQQVATREGGVD